MKVAVFKLLILVAIFAVTACADPSTPASTITTTTPCVDKFDGCYSYSITNRLNCSTNYPSKEFVDFFCPKFCDRCDALTTTLQPTPAPCVDKIGCYSYSITNRLNCSTNYPNKQFIDGFCPKFCGRCLETTTSDSPTTTPPTIPPTTSADCVDKFDNCQQYSSAKDTYCNDASYAGNPWMLKNCAKFCGKCGVVTPSTPTPCADKFDNCQQYTQAYCSATTNPQGFEWIVKNCAKFCGFCGDETPTTPIPTTPGCGTS